jgi:tetratricopeptide (TPR) repeat protein
LQINETLQQRTVVVAQIFAGLVHFSQGDYDRALTLFNETQKMPNAEGSGSQEVLHVLIGNTQVRLAGEAAQRGKLDEAGEWVDSAISSYQAAEQAASGDGAGRPQYSRSYTGLASATYLQWNIMAQEQAANILMTDYAAQQNVLDEALGYLNQGRDAVEKPDDLGIDNRSRYARIQILYPLYAFKLDPAEIENLEVDGLGCRFQALDIGEGLMDRNNALLTDLLCNAEAVLFDYGEGENSLHSLAFETYFYVGQVALAENPDLCPPVLEEALNLDPPKIRRMFVNATLGECQSLRGDFAAAVTAYNHAIDLAYEIDAHPNDLARFTAAREEAQSYRTGRG